ncbi:MAG: hypothetical protein ACK5IQ_00235 [Bacteroidales bacterium]
MKKLLKLLPMFLLVGMLATSCSSDDDDNGGIGAGTLKIGNQSQSLISGSLVCEDTLTINNATVYKFELGLVSAGAKWSETSKEFIPDGTPTEAAEVSFSLYSSSNDGLVDGAYSCADYKSENYCAAKTYSSSDASIYTNLSDYENDEDGDLSPTKGDDAFTTNELGLTGELTVTKAGEAYTFAYSGKATVKYREVASDSVKSKVVENVTISYTGLLNVVK